MRDADIKVESSYVRGHEGGDSGAHTHARLATGGECGECTGCREQGEGKSSTHLMRTYARAQAMTMMNAQMNMPQMQVQIICPLLVLGQGGFSAPG